MLPHLQLVEKNAAILFVNKVVHMPVVYNDRCHGLQSAQHCGFPQLQHSARSSISLS